MARLSAQSVSTIISVYHLFVFLRFSPDEKLFRHREPQRAEEEMENTECRSVYDKISNRLERRQRKTGRRHKIGGFPFRVLSVWNYWQQEPLAIYTCLYICASVCLWTLPRAVITCLPTQQSNPTDQLQANQSRPIEGLRCSLSHSLRIFE